MRPSLPDRRPGGESGHGELILGFDIGATKIAVLLGTADGIVLEQAVEPTPPGARFDEMWAVMERLGDRLIRDGGRPAAIGACIGGPLDAAAGVIYSPPNLTGWDAVPLGRLLADRFRAPAYVEHDAKAGALAEWLFGAGRGVDNLVFLTFGTGLGAGIVVDGRLCRGRGGNLGEVGHWRMADTGPRAYGKDGSWEAFSSGTGLARLARYRYPGRWPQDLTAADLTAAARGGDADARAVVAESAVILGRGIAYLVDLLSPETVILGSLAVRAGDLFLPAAQAVVDAECTAHNLPCPVVASALGMRIGSVAALCAAIYPRTVVRGDRQVPAPR